MRTNPFYDSWLFLIGETDSHLGVGSWRYLLVLLFWSLAGASIYLAYRLAGRSSPANPGPFRHMAGPGRHRGHVVRGLPLEAADSFRRL